MPFVPSEFDASRSALMLKEVEEPTTMYMEVAVAFVSVVNPVSVVEAIVALVPKTSAPEPVSSVTSVDNSDEVSIEVDETLFWNVVQSVDAIYPFCDPFPTWIVNAPLPLLYESGVAAESEVELILLLKVDQSVEVKRPRAVAEADGTANVCVLPDEVIEKSVPDVVDAKSCVRVVRPFKDVIPPAANPNVEVATHRAVEPLV